MTLSAPQNFAATATAQLAIAQSNTNAETQARARADAFEASFLTTMLNTMFEGIGDDALTGGGFASDSYKSMQVEQFASSIVDAGGIGISDIIYRELIAAQENAA